MIYFMLVFSLQNVKSVHIKQLILIEGFLCLNNLYKCGSPTIPHESHQSDGPAVVGFLGKHRCPQCPSLAVSQETSLFLRPVQLPHCKSRGLCMLHFPRGSTVLSGSHFVLKVYVHYLVEYKICTNLKTQTPNPKLPTMLL